MVVLSDANLERYGIPAEHLAAALAPADNVRAAVVFIGSLGDQVTTVVNDIDLVVAASGSRISYRVDG